MNVSDIMSLWEKDSKIDQTELANESLKVPQLHHKYYKIYVEEAIRLKDLEMKYKSLYKLKYEYYMGTIDKQTLDQYGWEPNPLRILKQDLSIYIDSDVDLQQKTATIEMQKQKLSMIESIIKTINNRGYLIKNAIDWERFKVGG